VQALAEVRRIGDVAPSCFWPQPKVTSSMFALEPRPDPGLEDPAALGEFVTRLFSARRKQLGTILGRAATPWPDGVTADLRPEALTVDQIVELWRLRG
jgi:16S rRNA (adenine1518-N6/adenine1519-N6)-dimethyltransferase